MIMRGFLRASALVLIGVAFVMRGQAQQSSAQGQAAQGAQNSVAGVAAQLQLVPQPREVKLKGGEAFRVTRKTKIVVAKRFGRDFAGAQMLVDEVARWTGWKLKVDDAEHMPGGSDFIYIGDAMEDARLREALGTSGLAMQSGFDAQGYAILVERQRILVGGASEQGAFYGVQTLRQLLRPAGNAGGEKSSANDRREKEERRTSAAKAADCARLTAQLKPCPDKTERAGEGAMSATGRKANAGSSSQTPLLGITVKNKGAARLGPTVTKESDVNEAAGFVNVRMNESAPGAKAASPSGKSVRQSGVEPSFGYAQDRPHSKEADSRTELGGNGQQKAGSSPTSAAKAAAAGFGMTEKNNGAENAQRGRAQLLNVAARTNNTRGEILRSADGASLSSHEALSASRMTDQRETAARDARSSNSKSDYISELECPAVAIRDWPAMKWRGASVDISRGPIPTLEFMEKQIRTLAAYKLNLYGLYMEDVFTVKGNGIFAPPNALTPEEITQLVTYATKYYVTIMPELETFGHLHNVLRYDAYSDLAETPHGAVLTPTLPGSYDLIGKLISEMAPLFPGPFFHIGADETNELGQGKTKDLIAQQGLGQVYLAHIAKLDGMLKSFENQMMFWVDITEKFPQLLPTLPKDLIAVVWTYDVKPDYDADLDPFKNAGLPIFVSPGIGNWRKVYPDFNSGFMNIRNLTRDGQKYGAVGMLNTEWKDRGEELGGMDWPGLIFGAACGWQAGESSVEQFMDSYDWAFYRNADHTFEDALNKLAGTNTLLHGVQLDGTHVDYFWASPFSELGAEEAVKTEPVVHELRVDAEEAWESLLDNRAKAHMNEDTLDDLIFAAQRLDLLGMKFEYTQEMSDLYWNAYMDMANTRQVENNLIGISSTNGRLEDLRERLADVRSLYAERFRAQNHEAWLGNVLVRYDQLSNVIQEKINQIDALETEFRQVKVLPPPENLGFYLRPASTSQQ